MGKTPTGASLKIREGEISASDTGLADTDRNPLLFDVEKIFWGPDNTAAITTAEIVVDVLKQHAVLWQGKLVLE